MERIAAKIKVSTLLSNYVRRPRGRKLAFGTADRVTDRVLADVAAVSELVDLDPNDERAVAGFVVRFRGCFEGAGRERPANSAEVESLRINREVARTVSTGIARVNEEIRRNDRATTEERFLEDLLSLVSETPVLFRDLVGALRGSPRAPGSCDSGRRWRNLKEERVERALRDLGAFFRCRTYASGIAVYVATAPFDSIVDYRFGKTRAVREY